MVLDYDRMGNNVHSLDYDPPQLSAFGPPKNTRAGGARFLQMSLFHMDVPYTILSVLPCTVLNILGSTHNYPAPALVGGLSAVLPSVVAGEAGKAASAAA